MVEMPVLKRGEAHIISFGLMVQPSELEQLSVVLSAPERKRADRFHFDRHQRRFIVSHAATRYLLGDYLGVNPSDIRYNLQNHGKPALVMDKPSNNLNFNLAHSNDMAVVAVTRNVDIGVDVEFIETYRDFERIASRYFSRIEKYTFFELPDGQRKDGFFNCWTRKEAFIKCTGDGLNFPLDEFSVSLVPGKEARIQSIDGAIEDVDDWSMISFKPESGYIGAAVAKLPGMDFRMMNINPLDWL